jgi:hypothetical protein
MLKNSRCSSSGALAIEYGAHQRLAVDDDADHDEVAALEAQARCRACT